MKKIISIAVLVCLLATFFGCSAMDKNYGAEDGGFGYLTDESLVGNSGVAIGDGEYGKLIENKFINTSEEPTSTFSADVDTASYSYFRKLVKLGYNLSELIATGGDSVRTEEMINYFDYDYKGPEQSELFGTNVQIADCPWNENAVLMMLGLKAQDVEVKADNNLVFLIDVSGSMQSSDKLPLLKKSFSYLVDQLDEGDRVSIVTYSGAEKIVLKGAKGNKRDLIMNAVDSLEAKGSTNGEAGLKKAYQLAEEYFIEGGNNRIIMASDGDLNVGISSEAELESYISQKRESGVYLSVLGFGTGNYKDAKMETLADNGNGVYYYIDGETEAEKVFGSDIFSTLYTVAKDVKLQLTFDAENVESYRLVGYENRLLNKEDFEDDTKDAGDVGSGHCVTVCYELILTDKALLSESEWMTLAVRYKPIDSEKSELREYSIGAEEYTKAPNDDFRFVCSVIKTAMILHGSEYLGERDLVGLGDVIAALAEIDLSDDPEKTEFFSLIKTLHAATVNESV